VRRVASSSVHGSLKGSNSFMSGAPSFNLNMMQNPVKPTSLQQVPSVFSLN